MLFDFTPIDQDKFNDDAKTALFLACQNNHIKVVEILLEKGKVDLNLAELMQDIMIGQDAVVMVL